MEESFFVSLNLVSTGLNVLVAPEEADIFILDNDSKHFHKSLLFATYVLHDQVNIMILDG